MHVSEQRKGFDQSSGLKQHPATDMQLPQLLPFEPMQVLTENADLAGSGFQDSNQDIQKRAFAASAPAQNDEGFLWINFEADSIEDRPPIWKDLGQVDHLQNWRLARLELGVSAFASSTPMAGLLILKPAEKR